MTRTTVAIGSDHAGFDLKQVLAAYLAELGYDVLDLGTDGPESVDYPDFGLAVAKAVAEEKAGFGVVVCGTGIGISIAANRVPQVRAALCHDHTTAELSRRHNDANILALGSRIIGVEVAKDCLRTFLTTPFDGGRHVGRVAKLSAIA
jgi:ribose 5-phosphate isomerase B